MYICAKNHKIYAAKKIICTKLNLNSVYKMRENHLKNIKKTKSKYMRESECY